MKPSKDKGTRKVHRSPSYPAFDLETAIEKAKAVYDNEKRSPTTVEVLASHMGYSAAVGPGGRAVSALRQYALIEEVNAKYRLSDVGYTLVHYDKQSKEWKDAAATAATSPKLFKELKDEYPDGLPSDATLKNDLLKREFNPGSIADVVSILRSTMSLANSGESVHNEGVEDTLQLQDSVRLQVQDVRPGAPKTVKEILTQRVSPECMAQIVFDGPVSQKAVEKLIAYLELAKDNYQQ